MNTNSYFDINRLGHLLIRQLRMSSQALWIGFAAVAGLVTFILSMTVIFGHEPLSFNAFFGVIMPYFFAGGYVFTSTVFSELRTSHRGYLYLTLPASSLEKLTVSWLISSVLYVIASIAVLFIVNLLLIVVSTGLSGCHVPVFNLFDPRILKIFAIYLVTQPIFLLGAIYFRRVNFLKTLLALFVVGIVIAVYSSFMARLIVFHNFHSFNVGPDLPENCKNFFENIFAPVVTNLFWYAMGPFFLIVTYFRLKERQV